MAEPDEKIVRREAQNLDEETAQIKNPSTLEGWVPTGKTMVIIAIIIAIIAILEYFFTK